MNSLQKGTTPIGIVFFIAGAAISFFTFQSGLHIAVKALIFLFVGLPCLIQPFRY